MVVTGQHLCGGQRNKDLWGEGWTSFVLKSTAPLHVGHFFDLAELCWLSMASVYISVVVTV